MTLAGFTTMSGVQSFEELDAWKRSVELRDLVHRLIETDRARQDPTLCDQIRRSSGSAPANISEGWGRFWPKQHAHFLQTAKASLEETRNHLLDGRKQRCFDEEDFQRAMTLARRAIGATVGLINYLDSCEGRLPWEPRPKPRRKRRDPQQPEP